MAYTKRKGRGFSRRVSKRRNNFRRRRFGRRVLKAFRKYRKPTFSVRRMYKNMEKPTYAMFCIVDPATPLGSQNGYNAILQNGALQLADFSTCAGYNEFIAIYNLYRIVKVNYRYEFQPLPFNLINTTYDPTTTVTTNLGFYQKTPEWIFWKDTSGDSTIYTGATLADWNIMMNRDHKHFKRTNNLDISWKPRPLTVAYESGISTAEITMKRNPWVNCSETGLDYFGMNLYINNSENANIGVSNNVPQTLRLTRTIYVEFKQRQL